MAQTRGKDTGRQSDLLLWVAGGVVAAVGVAWLVILKPWAGAPAPDQPAPEATVAMASGTPQPPPDSAQPPAAPGAALDNPLRMAELAFQAGMLVDPPEYSAWTLYRSVLK